MPLRLLKGIRHFKNNQFKEKEDVFTALGKGQAPDVLFFGCIDSRVDVRMVTNSQLGELLVARNPGNIVPAYSETPSGELSSSEFALQHLNVNDIIVCGHSHCGAMKGLMTPGIEKELPNTAAWLSHAKDALDQVHEHHPELNDQPDEKLKCLTQNNVLLQIEHLKTHPAVAKRLAEGKLNIHGWYYEFEKGEIYIYNNNRKTFISFEETVDEIAQKNLLPLVQEEALAYLNELHPLKNRNYEELMKQHAQPNSVALVWQNIEAKVRERAKKELGELYLLSNGSLSSKFYELIQQGRSVQVGKINNKYQQIEQSFNEILVHGIKTPLSPNKIQLLAEVDKLKKHTLHQFAKQDAQFNFEQSTLLAKTTKVFVQKLLQDEATATDIATFKKLSHSFKPSLSTRILKTILAALAGIAAGLVSGFAFCGVPGALVGAGVGGVVALGVWATKKDSLSEFTHAASKVIPQDQERNSSLIAAF